MANDDEKEAERKNLLRRAYGMATTRLREQHRDDFNTLYEEAAKELDVEWHPRKTPEQKAEEQFETLLRDYPQLAERVQQTTG
jgi:hypothetical protein